MMTIYEWENGGLKETAEFSSSCWINLSEPTTAELEQVLSSIETYGDAEAFRRTGKIRSWLSPHFSPKYSSGLPVRA